MCGRVRDVSRLRFRTLLENDWDSVTPNLAILNVQELLERGVSIISGTSSSARVNAGVEWRPKALHHEEIASDSSACQSLVARVIATITHLYSVVTRE